jgi:hypothetical protein
MIYLRFGQINSGYLNPKTDLTLEFHTRSTRVLTRSSTFGMVIISSPVRLPDSFLLKYHVSFKLKATVSSSSWSTILTFSLSSLQQKIHLKYKPSNVSFQMIYEGLSHIQDQCTSTRLCFMSSEMLPVATEHIMHDLGWLLLLPFPVTFAPFMWKALNKSEMGKSCVLNSRMNFTECLIWQLIKIQWNTCRNRHIWFPLFCFYFKGVQRGVDWEVASINEVNRQALTIQENKLLYKHLFIVSKFLNSENMSIKNFMSSWFIVISLWVILVLKVSG